MNKSDTRPVCDELRDGLRRLVRDGGTSFLVGLMFGDVTGSGAVFMTGRSVLSASYTRDDETGADRFAVSVMHAWSGPPRHWARCYSASPVPLDRRRRRSWLAIR